MGFRSKRRWMQTAAAIWFLCSVSIDVQGEEKRIASPPAGDGAGQNEDAFTIKVGVEEVRLDAVVLDKKGRQITDLTADDFEIYQDKKRQRIIGGPSPGPLQVCADISPPICL